MPPCCFQLNSNFSCPTSHSFTCPTSRALLPIASLIACALLRIASRAIRSRAPWQLCSNSRCSLLRIALIQGQDSNKNHTPVVTATNACMGSQVCNDDCTCQVEQKRIQLAVRFYSKCK